MTRIGPLDASADRRRPQSLGHVSPRDAVARPRAQGLGSTTRLVRPPPVRRAPGVEERRRAHCGGPVRRGEVRESGGGERSGQSFGTPGLRVVSVVCWGTLSIRTDPAKAAASLLAGSTCVSSRVVQTRFTPFRVLALAVAMETASALSLAGMGAGWRVRSWPLLGFVGCCLAYRLHLFVQGHFDCPCLGRLPRWTPWVNAEFLGMVSWALLTFLAMGGAMVGWADAKGMDAGRGRTP